MSAFDAIWDAPVQPIETDADEINLIKAAQHGDDDATLRLLAAYVPHLRKAVRLVGRLVPLEDARQAALLGFMTALQKFDPARAGRLAACLPQYLTEAVLEAARLAAYGGFAVPPRTLRRFLGILDRAGGDPAEAARIAPQYAMSTDTFQAIWAAVRANGSLEAAIEACGDSVLNQVVTLHEVYDASDDVLVALAFEAVDDLEAEVCRLYYGFTEPSPLPDAEVGYRLGMHRRKAQRLRISAIDKMRAALGVA